MKEDGTRLSFSIEDKNFVINDLLTGKLVLNVHGQFTINNIDQKIVLAHLDNIQEALMSYTKSKPLFYKGANLSVGDAVIIRENDHLSWTLSYNGESAEIKNSTITMSRNFDIDLVLRRINRVLATVVSTSNNIINKSNIIRRVSDVGMLIWKYKEHTAVVYEHNCSGTMMFDCLVDGIYYPFVILRFNENNTVSVYSSTNDYEEILNVPLDESISYYFKDPQE